MKAPDPFIPPSLRGSSNRLMYLRTKEGKEVDFVLVDALRGPEKIIEVKYSDTAPSKNLLYFKKSTEFQQYK